jgi:hypothetical protein
VCWAGGGDIREEEDFLRLAALAEDTDDGAGLFLLDVVVVIVEADGVGRLTLLLLCVDEDINPIVSKAGSGDVSEGRTYTDGGSVGSKPKRDIQV